MKTYLIFIQFNACTNKNHHIQAKNSRNKVSNKERSAMTKIKEDLLGEILISSNLIQRGALDVETAMINQEIALPKS